MGSLTGIREATEKSGNTRWIELSLKKGRIFPGNYSLMEE
jgi:hypothetical protein